MEVPLRSLAKIEFLHKRNDVQKLCERLFDHILSLVRDGKDSLSCDRLLLVRALEEIFYPELVCVSGYTFFVVNPSLPDNEQKQELVVYPHHWLKIKDCDDYIIDVLPADGEFGLSVPQLVVQSGRYMRFLSAGTIYPADWGPARRESFHKQVEELVALFEKFIEERPL
jgi:hypothetical protein